MLFLVGLLARAMFRVLCLCGCELVYASCVCVCVCVSADFCVSVCVLTSGVCVCAGVSPALFPFRRSLTSKTSCVGVLSYKTTYCSKQMHPALARPMFLDSMRARNAQIALARTESLRSSPVQAMCLDGGPFDFQKQ